MAMHRISNLYTCSLDSGSQNEHSLLQQQRIIARKCAGVLARLFRNPEFTPCVIDFVKLSIFYPANQYSTTAESRRQATAFFFFVCLFTLSSTLPALCSDWIEDDLQQAGSVPRPAPPISRHNHQIREESQSEGSQQPDTADQTVFQVKPKAEHAPLEATVSRWGTSGPPANFLNGSAAAPGTGGFFYQLEAARAVAPSVFRNWLEKTHPQFALTTSTMDPMHVLEIKGQWDNADHTLHSFGVRHTTVKSGKLSDVPLDDVRVLVVNCAGKIPNDSYQKVRDFVARGGFLISTDWTVSNLVERCFPGYIAWNGGKTANKVVDATVTDPDPILFAGAVRSSGWKLDDGSQMVKVLNPSVRILARSRTLASEDPDRAGILAVVFAFGRGQVLHLVGHFDNNAVLAFGNMLPDPAPSIGISLRQALAANFLVEGLQQRVDSSH